MTYDGTAACPHCGQRTSRETDECQWCDGRLGRSDPSPLGASKAPRPSWVCPGCGTRLADSAGMCPRCGIGWERRVRRGVESEGGGRGFGSLGFVIGSLGGVAAFPLWWGIRYTTVESAHMAWAASAVTMLALGWWAALRQGRGGAYAGGAAAGLLIGWVAVLLLLAAAFGAFG